MSLYEEDIVGYSTSLVVQDFTGSLSELASILGDILIEAQWQYFNGYYTSQQTPWYFPGEDPPADYRGRIMTDIRTNFISNQLEFRPQDIAGQMKMDLSSIFSPPIRFFNPTGNKVRIVASQYQFILFSDDYAGNPNAVIVSAVQIPAFLQNNLGVHVRDVLFACEGDLRRQLWVHGNTFVAVNYNGALHYWNSSLINGTHVPAIFSNIDANFQQSETTQSGAPMIMPLMIEWGLDFGQPAKVMGFLWDMAMIGKSLTRDQEFAMAGQHFQVFGSGTEYKQYGSLVLNLSNIS